MKPHQKFIFFGKKKLKLITHREIEIWSELWEAERAEGDCEASILGALTGEREIGFYFVFTKCYLKKLFVFAGVTEKCDLIWI